jgi:hypothetical protein
MSSIDLDSSTMSTWILVRHVLGLDQQEIQINASNYD